MEFLRNHSSIVMEGKATYYRIKDGVDKNLRVKKIDHTKAKREK